MWPRYTPANITYGTLLCVGIFTMSCLKNFYDMRNNTSYRETAKHELDLIESGNITELKKAYEANKK